MLGYVVRRLLLLVPSLLVISLLAFGLQQCTPGDSVARQLPALEYGVGGQDALTRYDRYHNDYRRLAQQMGEGLPIFYFSLRGSAYPDTLHRVIPQARRELAQDLVAHYGNWSQVAAYLKELALSTRMLLADTLADDTRIDLLRRLGQLDQPTTPERIGLELAIMDSLARRGRPSAIALHQRIDALQTAYDVMLDKATPAKHWWPGWQWYGKENRYHHWLTKLAQGNLGKSLLTGQDVSEKLRNAIGWTLRMNLSSIFLAYLIAIPLGVYLARRIGSRTDRQVSIVLFLLYALPSFWVATLLSQFLTNPQWIDLFPSMGVGEIPANASWWEAWRIRAAHFFLPVFCLTYGALAYLTRQVRAAMVTVLQSDYVRTARAKGLSERRVLWRHAFPNALFPLITIFGSLLPGAIAGSIIIEQIFNIPGVGLLTIRAINNADWPIVYALLLLTAILTILGLLLADLLYAWADPRVKLSNDKTAPHAN